MWRWVSAWSKPSGTINTVPHPHKVSFSPVVLNYILKQNAILFIPVSSNESDRDLICQISILRILFYFWSLCSVMLILFPLFSRSLWLTDMFHPLMCFPTLPRLLVFANLSCYLEFKLSHAPCLIASCAWHASHGSPSLHFFPVPFCIVERYCLDFDLTLFSGFNFVLWTWYSNHIILLAQSKSELLHRRYGNSKLCIKDVEMSEMNCTNNVSVHGIHTHTHTHFELHWKTLVFSCATLPTFTSEKISSLECFYYYYFSFKVTNAFYYFTFTFLLPLS